MTRQALKPLTTDRRARLLAGLLLAAGLSGLGAAALAGPEQPVDAPLPPGFELRPLQRPVEVVYAHSQGEMFNTLSRSTLEASCRAAQAAGAAPRMPRFAPGSEDALKFEIRRYTSADGRQSASYSEKEHVECAEAELKTDGPCACNYRKVSEHSLYLERSEGSSTERWQLSLATRSGRYSRGPAGAAALPAPAEAALQSLFGVVAGSRELAGQRCQLRRVERGNSRIETCLLQAGPGLNAALHGRQLAQTVTQLQGPQAGQRLRWTETLQLLPRARVDAAVFAVPAGIQFKPGAISSREAQP